MTGMRTSADKHPAVLALAVVGLGILIYLPLRPQEAQQPASERGSGWRLAEIEQERLAQPGRWDTIHGNIEAGVTVYMRLRENDQPEPWFTILEPFVEGDDGPMMKVRYVGTGAVEYKYRRPLLSSDLAMEGNLIVWVDR